MGCAQSSAAEEAPAAATPAATAPVTEKPTTEKPAVDEPAKDAKPVDAPKKEAPRPQVFAIMRNGHEVIRGAQKDLAALLEKDDLEGAISLWEKHDKWMFIHMTMEEGKEGGPKGIFKMLDDECGGAASDAKLSDDHEVLEAKEKELKAAFEAKDLAQVKEAFAEYEKINSDHLVKEEKVMMPKIMEMAKKGTNMKKLMRADVLDTVVDSPDFEFFVKFANEILEKHPEGQPRVRVFDHALWAVATPDEWSTWDSWIKETVTPESYKELHDAIDAWKAAQKK